MKRILVVVAHPDDEVLGCGGTIAKLIRKGYQAYTLILGEGVTARDDERDTLKRSKKLESLKTQVCNANKMLGVKKIFMSGLADNRFDSLPLLDIVKVIEKIKKDVCPDIIFTHNSTDLNIDHQLTYKAVLTAVRPLAGESVKEILSFEVLSSTEWNYPSFFFPDVFFNITETLNLKLRAMRIYASELRNFPHPRSLEGIRVNALQRGMQINTKYAEAFKCVRSIR